MPLTPEQIAQLLNEKPKETKAPLRVQKGPLRHYDHEMRCVSKRCGSPTYYKVDGIPYCMTHALKSLNELAIRLTDRLEAQRLIG